MKIVFIYNGNDIVLYNGERGILNNTFQPHGKICLKNENGYDVDAHLMDIKTVNGVRYDLDEDFEKYQYDTEHDFDVVDLMKNYSDEFALEKCRMISKNFPNSNFWKNAIKIFENKLK